MEEKHDNDVYRGVGIQKMKEYRLEKKKSPILALAPMVRCGTTPLRLLAIHLGADLVYSEELIDHKCVKSERRVDPITGMVEFFTTRTNNKHASAETIYKTCPSLEKGRNIFQIGSSDTERAKLSLKLIENDVSGIDLNCGCPKQFSIQNGMGAALLKKPELLFDILKTLVRNVSVNRDLFTVSCKIRMLDNHKDTISLVQSLEKTGIDFFAIHARTVKERPTDPAHWNILKDIVQAVNIPVLVNGDIWDFQDCEKVLEECGAAGVLFARGALKNPTKCFQPKIASSFTLKNCLESLARLSFATDNNPTNTKYTLTKMIYENETWKKDPYLFALNEDLQSSKTHQDLFKALELDQSILHEPSSSIGLFDQIRLKQCCSDFSPYLPNDEEPLLKKR